MSKFLIVFYFFFPVSLIAQADLMTLLNKEEVKSREYAVGVFKGTKIVNGQSTEQPGKKVLQFMISHRFGRLTGGIKQFFGLDYSTIRFCVEYAIIDNLEVGFGRSSYQQTWDGFSKWRIIRQQKGRWNIPITISAYASIAIRTDAWANPTWPNYFTSRLYYSYQLLFSRRFGPWFSLQLMPTMVHRNIVTTSYDHNDVFAMGIAGSLRLTRSMRLSAEYYYVFPNQIVTEIGGQQVRNCLSIGLDMETGGHIFQVHLSNSTGMIEKNFVTETTGNWFPKKFSDFGVQLGFNISRTFAFGKHKGKKKKPAKEETTAAPQSGKPESK